MAFHIKSNIALTEGTTHNAFTDLTFYKERFWCAYRSASSHMLLDGQIIILTSLDGHEWREFQVISWAGADLRDPKFVINQAGELLMLSGVRMAAVNYFPYRVSSVTWFLQNDGKFTLSNTQMGTWRWSGALLDNTLFSVGYSGVDRQGALYSLSNNHNWQTIVKPFFPESDCFTNETSLAFDAHNEIAYALVRRDGAECYALLGRAQPPFTDWHWQELDSRIGGPKLVLTSEGKLIAGFRVLTEDSAKMVLAEINTSLNQFNILLELPSSGDCSYPGMLLKNGHLYISYYSSHEKGTQIYFAVISFS